MAVQLSASSSANPPPGYQELTRSVLYIAVAIAFRLVGRVEAVAHELKA